MKDQLEELWEIVRNVPPGTVASYGAVGRALNRPASGYFVGRWMAQCPDDGTPWWRIVNKRGELPITKRDPRLGMTQQAKLEAEGVEFVNGRIPAEFFIEP